MPRVLFLIQGPDRPASRYRVLQFTDYISANGVAVEVETYPAAAEGWRRLEPRLGGIDVVFVQKNRLTGREASLLKRGGCRIIFDFDDAVMYKSSRHALRYSWGRRRSFARTCRSADLVIAGNDYLRSHAARYNGHVEVIPTCIDTDNYPPHEHAAAPDRLIVGWIGGRKSVTFLQSLAPVLAEVCRRFPAAILKVVSGEFPSMAGVPMIKTRWEEAAEAKEVATFDVGLAPLPDDVWSRGKCATKLLQCMAAGVPCVASAVGVHRDIVRHGVNGFLASTHGEWIEGLVALLGDGDRRTAMGELCRKAVEEGYSVRAHRERLLRIIRELAAER